ncbi:MAG: FlgD immunoglobulin-like domain containing protein [Candidatus Eisenbacteria bacterium]
MRFFFGLIVCLTLFSTLASAQVPKAVLAEDATATWCQYCPAAYQGLEIMKSRYDANEFAAIRYFSTSGSLGSSETDARINYYQVTGYPTVMFDGSQRVVGGGAVVATGSAYDPLVSGELGVPSPLKITIDSADLVGPAGSISFHVEVADNIADISGMKIRGALLENDVYWCCGYGGEDTWEDVTRDVMPDVALSVSQTGQVQPVTHNFTIDPTWETPQLWMVVWVQDDTHAKYIIQSESTRPKPAYSLRYWAKGDRATIGPSNGTFEYQDFAVFNMGTSSDVIRVALDPGTLPQGWNVSFSDGNVDYTDYVDLNLASGESRVFHVKVQPTRPGYASPAIVLTSPNLPGVERRIGYSYVTDDVQVLVVDDDGAESYEDYYVDALANYGATFGVWNRNFAALSGAQLQNFPVVFWEIGLSYPTLTDTDRAALSAFLDGGGKLFINGQDLGWEMNDNGGQSLLWYHNYLHAGYYADDTNRYNLTGVAGDPISDGMTLVIQGGDGANNQEYPDAINPFDAYATSIFSYDGYAPAKAALKVDTGVYRVVYLGFGYEAISTQANRRLLVERILGWFGVTPMDVGDPIDAAQSFGVQAFPNPVHAGTTLSYQLPSSGPVRIGIYDLDGSLVRELAAPAQDAGKHTLYWDGRNSSGNPVASGVYFYRLHANGMETPAGKLILTR